MLSASLAVNNIGQNTRFIGAHKDKIALHQSFERIQMKLKLILKKKSIEILKALAYTPKAKENPNQNQS